MRLLSQTFRSIKPPNLNRVSKPSAPEPPSSTTLVLPISRASPEKSTTNSRAKSSWCVYLIISTNPPIKTYVGVTTNFSRRLRQHNGELKGGAKASRAGRPWICACLIRGFNYQGEACEFESKWKNVSRKLPRKKKDDDVIKQSGEGSHQLLQHRQRALNTVKTLLDCSSLEIDWQLNAF